MTHSGGQPSAAEDSRGGKPAAPAFAVVMRYPRLGAPTNVMMKRHKRRVPRRLPIGHAASSSTFRRCPRAARRSFRPTVFELRRCEISARQPSGSDWRAWIGIYLQKASPAQHARSAIEKRHIMANSGATFRSRPQAPDLMARCFARAVSDAAARPWRHTRHGEPESLRNPHVFMAIHLVTSAGTPCLSFALRQVLN
jgi:hypothetical protein